MGIRCIRAKLLFEKESERHKEGVFRMSPSIDLSPFMSLRHFEDIKTYFPNAFADFSKKSVALNNHDPWYMISMLIEDFNNNRGKMVAASVVKLLDESMSAWRPRKSKTGGLPNISFILQKPEPLGTEFKCMACSETGIMSLLYLLFLYLFTLFLKFCFIIFIYFELTGIMLYLEIQRGKAEMPKWSARYRELGATASCTVRAAMQMANSGQR